jgi:hypothetical protein
MQPLILSRSRQKLWVYFLPTLHFSVCLVTMLGAAVRLLGYAAPKLDSLGILWTYVMIADLPVSVPAYFLAYAYPLFAWTWILVAGTLWWYLLSRGVRFVLARVMDRSDKFISLRMPR